MTISFGWPGTVLVQGHQNCTSNIKQWCYIDTDSIGQTTSSLERYLVYLLTELVSSLWQWHSGPSYPTGPGPPNMQPMRTFFISISSWLGPSCALSDSLVQKTTAPTPETSDILHPLTPQFWDHTPNCQCSATPNLKFGRLTLTKIFKFVRMSESNTKVHQIQFRLGLRPRPQWGSLQRFPRPYSWI